MECCSTGGCEKKLMRLDVNRHSSCCATRRSGRDYLRSCIFTKLKVLEPLCLSRLHNGPSIQASLSCCIFEKLSLGLEAVPFVPQGPYCEQLIAKKQQQAETHERYGQTLHLICLLGDVSRVQSGCLITEVRGRCVVLAWRLRDTWSSTRRRRCFIIRSPQDPSHHLAGVP